MKKKMIEIYKAFMLLGHLMGCHQMPERSFFWRQYQFPVCARCTGIIIGYMIGIIMWPFYKIKVPIAIALCGLMYLDWKLQDLAILPSNNLRRLITGTLCGMGYIHLVATVITGILHYFA